MTWIAQIPELVLDHCKRCDGNGTYPVPDLSGVYYCHACKGRGMTWHVRAITESLRARAEVARDGSGIDLADG